MNSLFRVIFVGLGLYPPHGRFGPAEFPHHDLFTVREGRVQLHFPEHSLDLGPGDAVLIPPGTPFHGEFGEQGGALWVLHFAGYAPGLLLEQTAPLTIRRALSGDYERRTALRLYELHQQPSGPNRDAAEAALTHYLLNHVEQIATHPETVSSRRREFNQLLSDAIPRLETGLHVSDLAREAGLSESYFRAEFQRLFGHSPQTALKELRLEEARRLLQETRRPVKEISQQVGYHDVSAFHRAFFRAYGQTPVAFRRGSPSVV